MKLKCHNFEVIQKQLQKHDAVCNFEKNVYLKLLAYGHSLQFSDNVYNETKARSHSIQNWIE